MTAWLLAPILFSAGYDILGTLLFRDWLREAPLARTPVPPVTIFRPLKRGIPGLREKIADLCHSMQPGDQLLVGIYRDDTGQGKLVQEILAAHPNLNVQVVLCEADQWRNPKINKLVQMSPLATRDHWIVLDAEVENACEFLVPFRQEWAALDFPVFSALYRFREVTAGTLPVVLTLWPGLAVLRKWDHTHFALGACMAVTRSQIDLLGGWKALGDFLAEDYQLGHLLASLGENVAVSRHLAQLDNDPPGLSAMLLQQHRMARTYRICQPLGFAGSILTHGPSFALLLVLTSPTETWCWLVLAWICTIRGSSAWLRCQEADWPGSDKKVFLLAIMASFLETAGWLAAWLPLPVWWAGTWRGLRSDGSFRDPQTSK